MDDGGGGVGVEVGADAVEGRGGKRSWHCAGWWMREVGSVVYSFELEVVRC